MNHLKLILGLTPVTCVVFAIVQWFVVGTMEHGWEAFYEPCAPGVCPLGTLHLAQALVQCFATILFIATIVLGIQEARKAWGRIRS